MLYALIKNRSPRARLSRFISKASEIGSFSIGKGHSLILMYNMDGLERYYREKGQYCAVLYRFWIDF